MCLSEDEAKRYAEALAAAKKHDEDVAQLNKRYDPRHEQNCKLDRIIELLEDQMSIMKEAAAAADAFKRPAEPAPKTGIIHIPMFKVTTYKGAFSHDINVLADTPADALKMVQDAEPKADSWEVEKIYD